LFKLSLKYDKNFKIFFINLFRNVKIEKNAGILGKKII
jgi:hypothetical protein